MQNTQNHKGATMNITKVTFKDFRNLGCANLAPDNANGLSNDLKLNGGG